MSEQMMFVPQDKLSARERAGLVWDELIDSWMKRWYWWWLAAAAIGSTVPVLAQPLWRNQNLSVRLPFLVVDVSHLISSNGSPGTMAIGKLGGDGLPYLQCGSMADETMRQFTCVENNGWKQSPQILQRVEYVAGEPTFSFSQQLDLGEALLFVSLDEQGGCVGVMGNQSATVRCIP